MSKNKENQAWRLVPALPLWLRYPLQHHPLGDILTTPRI